MSLVMFIFYVIQNLALAFEEEIYRNKYYAQVPINTLSSRKKKYHKLF